MATITVSAIPSTILRQRRGFWRGGSGCCVGWSTIEPFVAPEQLGRCRLLAGTAAREVCTERHNSARVAESRHELPLLKRPIGPKGDNSGSRATHIPGPVRDALPA